MNQKFPSKRSRDWRIPDPTCPLQNLIRKTSSPQINPNYIGSSPTVNSVKLKDVAKPTSFGKFLVILIMYICRKILYINLKYRLIIYFCSTVVVSLITDHFPPPGTFLSDPTSLMNTFFATYSWTITCGLLAVFIYLTGSVFYCGQLYGIHRNLSRLIILAGWSYLCSFASDVIEYRYSFCVKGGNVSKELCTGRWISFTMSNRAFLLIQSIIVISEEIKALVVWDRLGEIFNKKEEQLTCASDSQFKTARTSHEESSAYVKATVMILALLTILLDIVNFSTIVYFDSMPQKILANAVAIVGWLLTYKTWFCNKSFYPWCPGVPGQNLLIAI